MTSIRSGKHEYAHSILSHVEGVFFAGNSHFHQLRQLDGLRSDWCRMRDRQGRRVRTTAYSVRVTDVF